MAGQGGGQCRSSSVGTRARLVAQTERSGVRRLGDYVFGLCVHSVGGEQNGKGFCCFVIL